MKNRKKSVRKVKIDWPTGAQGTSASETPLSTNISRCKIIPAEESDVFAENILQDQFVSSASVSAQMDLKSYFKIQ